MAAKSDRLFRLRAKAFSFPFVASSAPDFSTGTVHEIRANQDIEYSIPRANLDDMRIVQFMHEKPAPKLGLESWSLSFSTYLHSHNLTLDGSTPYAQTNDYLGFLLATGLGGETFNATAANSAVASGAATTGFVVTGTHGARFLPGQGYAVNPNSLGYLEAREVLSRSTDTLTNKIVFSQAPAVADVVVGGQTTYACQNTALSSGVHFLGFGHDANDQIVLANGVLTGFALTIATGQLPTIKWTWEGSGFLRTTGQTYGLATYNGGNCAAVRDSEISISSTAGTTRVLQQAPEFSYTIGLTRAPWGSPTGIHGVYERVHLGCDVGASITLPFDSAKSTPYTWVYNTGREAGTRYQWFHQMGRTAGNTVLLSLPTLDVMTSDPVKVGGIRAVRTTFRGDCDRVISSGDDDLELANFRIHRF